MPATRPLDPELDRLRAQLSALMTYRTAADLLGQMFPVDAGTAHETLRRHTLKVAEELPMPAAVKPATPAEMITVTLDSTFIRSACAARTIPTRSAHAATSPTGRDRPARRERRCACSRSCCQTWSACAARTIPTRSPYAGG